MFIVLIFLIRSVIEYSTKNTFRNKKSTYSNDKEPTQKPQKKRTPRVKKLKYGTKGMLGVAAAPHGLEEVAGVVNKKLDCSTNLIPDSHIKSESYLSNVSSDEFIQDSSDYQWFTDYSYKDGSHNLRASILSSLSASYSYNDLCYNDLARDIDVNLAQVDMEDFKTEDIHSLLHTLPQICCSDVQNERHGEMYASVSGSLMVKYDFDSSLSHHSISQEESNPSHSFYKSDIQFSPVKEVPVVNFSTDSLDCEDHDIMLTCQANKDNYTIAFEGSALMECSDFRPIDDSMYTGSVSQEGKSSDSMGKISTDTPSMDTSSSACQFISPTTSQGNNTSVRSESPYTTWSKIKKNSSDNILRKHPITGSINPATSTSSSNTNFMVSPATTSCIFFKSQSLPNLNPIKHQLLHKRMFNSIVKNTALKNNHFDGCVKIFSLSSSDYGRKMFRKMSRNSTTTDLISRFINQKHTKYQINSSYSSFERDKSSAEMLSCRSMSDCSSNILDIGTNPKQEIKHKVLNNDNDKVPNNDNDKERDDCLIFEDSLVGGGENPNQNLESTESRDCSYLDNSSSSFSSHSGRLELSQTKDAAKKPNDKVGKNNSFESALNYLSERRKAHLMSKKYCTSEPSPIKIMDRSIQTSILEESQRNRSLRKENSSEETSQPVYVMYPNYTLPDLSFLRDHATEFDLKNIFLWPQKFSPSPTTEHAATSFASKVSDQKEQRKRPCSCPDFETLKQRDYKHIRDWESLMFLLPREYCQVLMNMPSLEKYMNVNQELGRSLLCTSGIQDEYSTQSGESSERRTTCVSSCSTGTQPSSGYRGSSTMLSTDSSTPCTPHYIYKYDNRANSKTFGNDTQTRPMKAYSSVDRPPLPRGILRNPALQTIKSKKNMNSNKRYSMFELREQDDMQCMQKRRSLPSQLASGGSQQKVKDDRCEYYSEDEGVESSSSHCESPGPQFDQDAKHLEQLLKASISWNDEDVTELRNQVNRCLSQQQLNRKTVSFADSGQTPPNSPNSSITAAYKPYQMKLQPAFDIPIHEECESVKHSHCDHIISDDQQSSYWTSSLNFKRDLIDAVADATKRINVCFIENNEEAIAQTALNTLCPALYAILNHGLKSSLETAFGDINNSVWQVVEASSQQGPMTRALHELVLKLNNEDVLTEGVLKFNAFIFGLLNVRGLDTWFRYLRTRESILRKHYLDNGLLLSSTHGITSDRQLVDLLLAALKPLAQFNFKLDLLYECRQLHRSLMQLGKNPIPCTNTQMNSNRTSWVLKKIVRSLQNVTGHSTDEECSSISEKSDVVRPRSCIDSSNGFTFNDIASTVKRRWSGIQFGSKLASAFERLGVDDDEYSDSLENTVHANDRNLDNSDSTAEITSMAAETDLDDIHNDADQTVNKTQGRKFKRLQRKWEMLAEKDPSKNYSDQDVSPSKPSDASFTISKSRIPRPVTSPVRPPSLQFAVAPATPTGLSVVKKQSPSSPSSNIPMPIGRKTLLSLTSTKQTMEPNVYRNTNCSRTGARIGITTAVRPSRIDQSSVPSHIARPSSLPQHRSGQPSHDNKMEPIKKINSSSSLNKRTISPSRYVRTLSHRLPSDNGHLSFNEGEKLSVIFDIDDKWILCCRGDQKGLVPRSAVLPFTGHF